MESFTRYQPHLMSDNNIDTSRLSERFECGTFEHDRWTFGYAYHPGKQVAAIIRHGRREFELTVAGSWKPGDPYPVEVWGGSFLIYPFKGYKNQLHALCQRMVQGGHVG